MMRLLTVMLATLLFQVSAWAVGVSATINRAEVHLGDHVILTVTIEGSQRGQPELPDLSFADVFSGGERTQMSFVNGQRSSSKTYTYIVAPKKAGSFTIGPVRATVGDTTDSSQPIGIKVYPASAAGGAAGGASGQAGGAAGNAAGNTPNGGARQAPAQPKTAANNDAFITASVSKKNAFVGEQIVYTFRFYRRVRIAGADLELPDFDAFVSEDLGEQRQFETTHKGQGYVVTEIKKALFAQSAGSIKLPPAQLITEVVLPSRRRRGGFFDSFFDAGQTQRRTLRSAAITLTITAPPAPPAGFSGLVGNFDLKARLSRNQLKVGESTRLDVTVSGQGNTFAIVEPNMGRLEGFKVYDDKPVTKINKKGARLGGKKRFRKDLVAMQAGDLSIPTLSLIVFDPEAKRYKTLKKGPFAVQVEASDVGETLNLTEGLSPSSGKVAVTVLSDDLLPNYRKADALKQPLLASVGTVWGAAMSLPPLLYLMLTLWLRRREQLDSDQGLRRKSGAFKQAVKDLKELTGKDERALAEGCSTVLRQYIGDHLNIAGRALTASDTRTHLQTRGLEDTLIVRIEAILCWAEALQYGAPAPKGIDASSSFEEMNGLLKELERSLR